ncbi:type II secretion system F family protein [Clostridium sp.]|uniref:type II secretion system F family protein n=1 Tax=Clostridium sp. TaxID=1506 RepID=UPI002850E5CA|nr:type II secretion system F family protein [Clostridium sp.]MDR3596795.1 type II secretion system F family protein [Clostridium sp.]
MNRSNENQLSLISGSLAQIYMDGIPISIALELVEDVVPNKIYKNSLSRVLFSVKQGKSLSESFAQFNDLYPEFFTGIISIGEDTGKLYEVLKGLNVFYDKVLFIKKEIRSACAYPIFVFISMIILGLFLLNKIIPSFCEIYKSMNIELPASCKFLYDVNNNFKSNPIIGITTIISWMTIGVIIFRFIFNKLDIGMFVRINIVNLFIEYMMVLLFSIITSTGINISHALEYCENNMSITYFKKKIREINKHIKDGATLTQSVEKSKSFSKYTLAMIRVYEEGGRIDEGFKELAQNLEHKLYDKIKRYLKYINPIFICIMASFIVTFILGFVLPLFDKLQSGIIK